MSASSLVSPEFDKSEDRIPGPDHAEIAVTCLDGMNELSRRAGGRQSGRDLAADMTALADPGDDDPATHRGECADGASRTRRPVPPPTL